MLRSLAAVLVLSAAAAASAAEPEPQRTLAVLELRTTLGDNDRVRVDPAALEDRIRDVAEKAMTDVKVLEREPVTQANCEVDCQLTAARKAGANLYVAGELLRVDEGLLVSLELRDLRSGHLLSMQTALVGSPKELPDAVSGATRDLLKPKAAALAMGPDRLPELPAPPAALQPSSALNLAVDADVLVAYDNARKADAHGEKSPEAAALAWEDLAELRGKNPYVGQANARAAQWRSFGATRSAFEAQISSDTEQLRKVLPLESVRASARLELLGRYARAYGADRALSLVALLPEALRGQANLTVHCELRTGEACVALAKLADQAQDAKSAANFLELACEAGVVKSCAEVGDRLLRAPLRDPPRAIAALERGCNVDDAKSCARLARVYEFGDGTDANLEIAGRLRDQACTAGDGRSCRKLACFVEEDSPAADTAKALSLSQRGCTEGDAVACAIAKALSPKSQRKVIVPGQKSTVQKRPLPPLSFGPPPVDADRGAHVVAGVILIGTAMGLTTAFLANGIQPGGGNFGSHHPFHDDGLWGGPHQARQIALSGGALLSGLIGFALLLHHPEPQRPQVAVVAGPGGLMLTGTLP